MIQFFSFKTLEEKRFRFCYCAENWWWSEIDIFIKKNIVCIVFWSDIIFSPLEGKLHARLDKKRTIWNGMDSLILSVLMLHLLRIFFFKFGIQNKLLDFVLLPRTYWLFFVWPPYLWLNVELLLTYNYDMSLNLKKINRKLKITVDR